MKQTFSTQGINLLKEIKVKNDNLIGIYKQKPVFKIHKKYIKNCNSIKNDLSVEFTDPNAQPFEDTLTELRLFIHQLDQKGVLANAIEEEIKKNIKKDHTGLICILPEIPFLVPRGKYSADLYKDHMKLHGSSYNYNILYSNMNKAFLLPMNENDVVYFVIGFQKPLRQGQTNYEYVVIQFKIDQDVELELKMKINELKIIDNDLEVQMDGKYFEIFARYLYRH